MDESKVAIGSEVQVKDASSNAGIDVPTKMLEAPDHDAKLEAHSAAGSDVTVGEIGGIDESKLAITPVGSEVQVKDASSTAGNDAPSEMLEVHAEEARAGNDVIASPVRLIGGFNSGTQRWLRGWTEGKVVTRIRVYREFNRIKAYQIWLTDSPAVTYGDPGRSNYAEYTFQTGERLTSLTLWGNGVGTHAGWIRFTTTRGLTFSTGMSSWNPQTPFHQEVGSGILVGGVFNTGEAVYAHGFCLLNAIDHAELNHVRYPTLSFDTAGIAPKLMDRFRYENNSTTPRDWDFTRTMSETTEQTWGIAVDVTVYANISVSAGIPFVADVSSQFGWQVSVTGHYETTQTSEQQFNWSVSGIVPPGHTVHIDAVTRMGTINTPYEGTMVVRLRNGSSFSYPVRGWYRGVSYTAVHIIDNSTR